MTRRRRRSARRAGRRRCRDATARARTRVGVDPDPRPRAAVGSARRRAALFGRPHHPQQPHPRRRAADTDRPGGADGLPGGRPAGGARPARRRRAAPAGAGARRHRSGRAAGHSRRDQLPGCADLHRSDRDAAWPAVAAQLRDTVGSADRATVLATAALALNQVDRVIRRSAAAPARRGAASAVDAGHHAGVRRQRRIDRGAPLVPASALHLLTTLLPSRCGCSATSWMMVW